MTGHPLLTQRAEALLGLAVVATAPVAGGDICVATKLRLSDGTTAFAKTLAGAPEGFFATEAAGLEHLRTAAEDRGGVGAPRVLAVADDVLILEWVEPGRGPTADDAARFGRELAATHAAGATAYGGLETSTGSSGPTDGFIGKLPLPQRPAPTWAEFYATRRVLPYLKLARDRRRIGKPHADAVERLVPRLPDLLPEEPPSLLHGDLWNGNVIWGAEGRTHVVDPAAYGGHREADLAMLSLFGLPHLPRVLEAYVEAAPLTDGWEDRIGLHQLFPLLVHACLFGGGYGARAAAVAARY